MERPRAAVRGSFGLRGPRYRSSEQPDIAFRNLAFRSLKRSLGALTKKFPDSVRVKRLKGMSLEAAEKYVTSMVCDSFCM